jgi:hypothetical protein
LAALAENVIDTLVAEAGSDVIYAHPRFSVSVLLVTPSTTQEVEAAAGTVRELPPTVALERCP